MGTLYGITQSPWTEKARWALDHHRVPYRYHEHVPLIGEVLLRRTVRKHGGTNGKPATVPLYVDRGQALTSSFEIARYAERVGRGASLFPKGHEGAIERWNEVSDAIIGVGRARTLSRLRTDRALQREALPSFIPGFTRGAFAISASLAGRFLASKHDVPRDVAAASERTLRPALEEVRAALAGGDSLVSGAFSYADVAIASSMRALRPEPRANIGPLTRDAWTDEAIARDFEDLLMWRDAVYAKHR